MYRTAAQIESAITILSSWFPAYFTKVPLPNLSVEGRPISAMRMRFGQGPERRGVLVIGGTHARELMNPDAIIELAIDLLMSHGNETDINYGNKRFTADDVKVILESLDLWLLPCLNPDGRVWVQTEDDLWRKNRRAQPGTFCMGVDNNRNYDFLWAVTQYQTSCSPCSLQYVGTAPFSEPETKNVKHMLDQYRICCMVDVHSYSELVLYPWGHVPTQTDRPEKRFTGLPSGTCRPIADASYKEYMPPRDLLRFQRTGKYIVDAIKDVRRRPYVHQPSVGPLPAYPTTGSAHDYAYSRHIADPALAKVYGFSFETGPRIVFSDGRTNEPESFHPADPTLIKRDTKAGILALAQQCVCAIDLIGTFLGRSRELAAMRLLRDERLAKTEAGREWIERFERVQPDLLPLLLTEGSLRRQAEALFERAAELLENEALLISERDVEQGRGLLAELSRHSRDDSTARDLREADDMLQCMAGRTLAQAVDHLVGRTKAH